MKFSLSSRQSDEYLKKADEIKVRWRDRRIIPDLYEKYPTATINLVHYFQDDEMDWDEVKNYNILGQGKLILGLSTPKDIMTAKSKEYKFYFCAGVRTFQELNEFAHIGVCRMRLAAPLFFQMDKVRKVYSGPIVAVANSAAIDSLIELPNGVCGTWIRPEDVPAYEPYIEVLEFIGDINQEQALYRIYAEQHAWSGDLNMVIQDLHYPCTNRLVISELVNSRLNCGQRCQEGGSCRICYRAMDIANPQKLREYLDATKKD